MKFVSAFIIFCSLIFCSGVKAETSDSKTENNILYQTASLSDYENREERKNSVYLSLRGMSIFATPFLTGLNFGYGRNNIFMSQNDLKHVDFFSVGSEIILGYVEDFGYIFGFPFRYGWEFKLPKYCKCSLGVNGVLQPAYATEVSSKFTELDNGNETFDGVFYIAYGLEGFVKIKTWHSVDIIVRGGVGAVVRPTVYTLPLSGLELGGSFSF